MTYVDGFVLVVPRKKIKQYEKMARQAGKVWMKHGALSYKECIGDDLNPNMGVHKILTFPKLTKLKKGEKVWYSFITYKNKAHRNSVNKKVMKQMEKDKEKYKNVEMPFDMKKMAYGGFKAIVDL